jgi:hypothetical protein
MGKREAAGRETTKTREQHHLPPGPRATARGVDRGWKDNDHKEEPTQ